MRTVVFSALSAVVVLALSAPADALAGGLQAHGFEALSGADADYTRVASGDTGSRGTAFAVTFDEAARPLVERTPYGATPVIGSLSTLTATFAVHPTDRLRLEASMPLSAGLGGQGSFVAPGDLRVGVAGCALRWRGLGVSWLGEAWAPTGAGARGVGAPTVAAGGLVAVGWEGERGGFAVDAGARVAPGGVDRNVVAGPAPIAGIGAHVEVTPSWGLAAEVVSQGTTGWSAPVEASAGPRVRLSGGRFLSVQIAAGLDDAVGSSEWRVVAAIGRDTVGPATPPVVVTVPEVEPAPPPEPVIEVVQAPPQVVLAHLVGDRIVLGDDIWFDEGSSDLVDRDGPVLQAVADLLAEHPEVGRMVIAGHTNDHGSASRNQALSEARARAVADWLVAHGVDAGRLVVTGYGESRPLVPPGDPDADRVNRRVEMTVLPAGGPPAR